jgi:hypothetical protein
VRERVSESLLTVSERATCWLHFTPSNGHTRMRRTWADYAHSGLITHILPDDGLMTHSTDRAGCQCDGFRGRRFLPPC